MGLTEQNALHGYTDEDSAYYVEDYPYGYRLRTTIRYWLETDAKHGDRFCSQTLNPKTARWNKAKKSTYCLLGAMYLDEQGHVTWAGINHWTKPEILDPFVAIIRPHMSDRQLAKLAEIRGVQAAYKDVTFSIHEGAMSDEEKAEQAAIQAHINRRVAVETSKALFEEMVGS